MKDGEIKHKLSPAQVSVMQHRVTEPPYFGKFWDHFEAGRYRCAACDTALFSSDDKFDSKTGWPSFKKPLSERDLQFKGETGPDDKVEIRCKKCKSHLGYVIAGDNPYYRINSVCLIFEPTVVAPPAAALPPTHTPAPVLPTKSDIALVPPEAETETSSKTMPLLVGLIVGLIAGTGGTYYMMKTTLPLTAPTETATTTQDVATTTPETPLEEQEEPAPVVETQRTEPADEPILSDLPPTDQAASGTSTQ